MKNTEIFASYRSLLDGRDCTYILTALHSCRHGSYQLSVGYVYSFALSQPSVSKSIVEVSDCISTHLLNQWIQFPNSEDTILIKKHP
jgi:hypothetical protein